MSLPTAGLPADRVLEELRTLRSADLPTHGGRTLAYVYDSGLTGLDGKPSKPPRPSDRYGLYRFDPAAAGGRR